MNPNVYRPYTDFASDMFKLRDGKPQTRVQACFNTLLIGCQLVRLVLI